MAKQTSLKQEKARKTVMSVVLAFICIIYMMPILTILINTFKKADAVKSNLFAFPSGDTFVGFDNYVTGMTAGSFPFWKAVLFNVIITVMSAFLILLFCSMAAWYVARVNSLFCKIFYYFHAMWNFCDY